MIVIHSHELKIANANVWGATTATKTPKTTTTTTTTAAASLDQAFSQIGPSGTQ